MQGLLVKQLTWMRRHFFSPDFFLYARCLAVAKGKGFYEHVVKHPEAMPKDDEFEELLTLVAEAFEEKNGRRMGLCAVKGLRDVFKRTWLALRFF